MTIRYGNIIVPDFVIERAKEGCRMEDSHLIWYGAISGKRNIPQIGFTVEIEGQKKTKVISVAKLLFVARYNTFPYQIRRDRALCQEKKCVNPEHFYAIPDKPEKRTNQNRNKRVQRVRYVD